NRVWLLGRNRLESACRQIKLAPEGKYFRTSLSSRPATAARSISATSKPTKNAPPVSKLPVWYAAKARGNKTIRVNITTRIFEKVVSGSDSDRSTVSGGTKRTETRGNTEKRMDTSAPRNNPRTSELHEIENPTSNGITPRSNNGIACCIPRPANAPIKLPKIPNRKIWMK